MRLTTKKFNELTLKELYTISRERFEVFVCEQKITCENEFDNRDEESIHIYIQEGEKFVGYLRILPKGLEYDDAPAIGRVLITKEFRKMGIGKIMLRAAIRYIKENFDSNIIKLSAQEYVKSIYESVGFKVSSDVYDEAGIPHVEMIYTIE
ncbi:GNAT family N-acetyltransferase [Clostridium baratii]|uniref:GNAT family N-acetyltransferase n=1 Tax=Clostridium baratii TaxID=1561 RepID=UPI0009A29E14|nr:GNAT family N-acetyltransferase [Clostridium baratii]OPF53033.1 GNAT family acetyltransferase [Clostridium baratii]OPF53746.1 GNAT family N-acetyltransferase [Clostridium baratii]OPF54404.1 GNAT family N-acetyltransferase [Clostridium baratii]OPF60876.1 GNAT family N-acetyltransferase [Clostridium baratii]